MRKTLTLTAAGMLAAGVLGLSAGAAQSSPLAVGGDVLTHSAAEEGLVQTVHHKPWHHRGPRWRRYGYYDPPPYWRSPRRYGWYEEPRRYYRYRRGPSVEFRFGGPGFYGGW